MESRESHEKEPRSDHHPPNPPNFQSLILEWKEQNLDTSKHAGRSVVPDSSLRVVGRIRPLSADEQSRIDLLERAEFASASQIEVSEYENISSSGDIIYLHKENNINITLGVGPATTTTPIEVHSVYCATEETFYEREISTAIRGSKGVTVLCYGQTGSGKTYTFMDCIKETLAE